MCDQIRGRTVPEGDPDIFTNRVRLEPTRWELERLDEAVKRWLQAQRNADAAAKVKGRHATRLNHIETVLSGALNALQGGINELAIDAQPASGQVTLRSETGAFYEQALRYDQAIVWLRRLWEYYESKFTQRQENDP